MQPLSPDTGFPSEPNATLLLPGPAGALEVATTTPSAAPAAATAVICHPHPLHGGTMHNKVVHMLARSFGELGLRTVRFNFRGVGQSEGSFAGAAGETDDALAVLEWARRQRPHDQIWLAGFSFGGHVALRAADRFAVTRLIAVAPAVYRYTDLGPPPPPRVPLLVLQGDQDEVVPAEEVQGWCWQLSPPPEVRMFPGVGHYFHGKLNELRATVQEVLGRHVPREPA